MKIIYNDYLPFKGYAAINLFGTIFARNSHKPLNVVTINHELIHSEQMKELHYIFFYVLYIIEWIYRLFTTNNAYRNISFEREAYANQNDLNYIKTRKKYSFLKYK